MFDILNIGFLRLNFVDLIDIIIVSIIFFGVYRALKNTIAIQILFGLVVLIALSFLTEAINLRALNWILKAISEIWLLAFIVLFQPELRKLMLIITQSPIVKLFVKSKISETIDEICETVIELSEKHIGALIVFPKSQNVEITIETGVRLQALVSKELLLSIFNTKSPLHDGAVIIDGQMIVAARCILPLSNTTKINNRNLGTRHRAALGLSEQVDAVILVVSEETGGISIANKGELVMDIPKGQIPKTLNSYLSNKIE